MALTETLTQMDDIDDVHRIQLAIRAAKSHDSAVLNRVFSRITIACMRQDVIDDLLAQCEKAIAYWRQALKTPLSQTHSHVMERLSVFIEVMARVSVRVTSEQAKQIFQLALTLCKDPDIQHDTLRVPLTHLAEFSLASIPESEHPRVLPLALQFPLSGEITIKGHPGRHDWVNPVIEFPGERPQDPALERRIAEIISHINVMPSNPGSALLRMLPLLAQGFLTDTERQKIAENIWGAEPDYKALPPTGLLRSVLLEIPSPDPAAVNVLIREYLFGARGEDAFSEDRLLSIVNAAMMEKHPERPTAEEALDAFNHMVMWRPADDEDFLGYRRQEEERRSGSLGKALAHSIVPALSPSMLTEENFSKLLDAFDAWKTPALLVTLTCFAYGNACFADRVERIIRQKLHAKDANCVAQASYALLAWREKAASAATSRLLTRMVFVISAHHLTGLQALLWTAHALLEKGFLAEEHIDLLAENLPIIFDSAAYENIPSASRESVSISFVRTGCVRLASAILKRRRGLHPELERIINDAARDPLPEVRFAERNRG